MPVIATSMARMRDAQSPSLRRLAASFDNMLLSDCEEGFQRSRGSRISLAIENSVWRTLIAHTAIPKVAGKAPTKRKRRSKLQEPVGTSQSDLDHNLLSIRPDVMRLEYSGQHNTLEYGDEGTQGPWNVRSLAPCDETPGSWADRSGQESTARLGGAPLDTWLLQPPGGCLAVLPTANEHVAGAPSGDKALTVYGVDGWVVEDEAGIH